MGDLVDLLAPWREAGQLSAAEVHVAATLGRLGGEARPEVLLAAALAARAQRYGDVCIDLRTVASVASAAESTVPVVWPATDSWLAAVAESPLVTGMPAPLVLRGSLLYLERYHAYETAVAEHLIGFASTSAAAIEADLSLLDSLFDGSLSAEQRRAVEAAGVGGLTVLVGGPGTGKTTTVAALLATLARSLGSLRVALVAPTGKAAARLGEAFRDAAAQLPDDIAQAIFTAETSTVHRLLGAVGESSSRFRHHRQQPLPHDVVIVDETSMVSLPLMAHLLDAVRPGARVVLVGDPGQLASVDAGSVLADLAGPMLTRSDGDAATPAPAPAGPLASCITVLTVSRRFPPGSPIDRLARAIGSGDAAGARAVLAEGDGGGGPGVPRGSVVWYPQSETAIEAVRAIVEPVVVKVADAAAAGDAVAALDGLDAARVLSAHRMGPMGVERWNERIEGWLAATGRPTSGWYPGRPIIITANDYRLGLFNGDLGVVVLLDGRPMVAFPTTTDPMFVAPSRLEAAATVHAMTIHKSQGSEFDRAVVVLPPIGSRLASRELLYTAVTRARVGVIVVGSAESLDEVVGRRTVRASGLGQRLWPGSS
ncbi:MAG: exodeoxyribonuclease V subunit alpha [Actinomycetota bacterium]